MLHYSMAHGLSWPCLHFLDTAVMVNCSCVAFRFT